MYLLYSLQGLENTFKYLLPPEYLENESINEYVKLSEKVGPSTGFVYCFVNLEGNPKDLGLRDSNLWIYPGYDHDQSLKNYLDRGEHFNSIIKRVLFFTFICITLTF